MVRNTRTTWETIFYPPEEVERRGRVRKRKSYRVWKEWWDYLQTPRPREQILKKIWQMIEERYGWRTVGFSEDALESLDLLVEDMKSDVKTKGKS